VCWNRYGRRICAKKIEELQPDVVTLDLDIAPHGWHGKRCGPHHAERSSPVILFSHSFERGRLRHAQGSRAGRRRFSRQAQGPAAGHLDEIADQLIAKIKVAKRAAAATLPPAITKTCPRLKKGHARRVFPPRRVIAIGISTGGPNACNLFCRKSRRTFFHNYVVQHMPEGFTEMFAKRLDECCALEVQEARSGDLLLAGRVLICPGNRHIMVRRMPRGDMVVLSDGLR